MTDSERPGCTIRQLVTGPITNTPASVAHTLARGDTNDGRFSYRLPTTQEELLTCISMAEKQTTEAHGALTSAYVKESHASSSQEIGDRQRGPSKAAPGWDDGAVRRDGDDGNRDTKDGSRNSSRADTRKTSTKGGTGGSSFTSDNRQCSPSSQSMRRQAQPVSADGKRSFLEALLDGGHSPATAIAAGLDPAENARGVRASMVAEAVKISMAGGTLVLGPVMGRVTQSSAIVLVEVGNTAAVGCVVTDSVTGGQHRQVGYDQSLRVPSFAAEFNRSARTTSLAEPHPVRKARAPVLSTSPSVPCTLTEARARDRARRAHTYQIEIVHADAGREKPRHLHAPSHRRSQSPSDCAAFL